MSKEQQSKVKMSEKNTRDFNLSALKIYIENLNRECKEEEVDLDDVEYEYEAVKQSWADYLQSQMEFIATIKDNERLAGEDQSHKASRAEFDGVMKLYKKTKRKLKEKDEPTNEDLVKNATEDVKEKTDDLEISVGHLEDKLREVDTVLNHFQLDDVKNAASKLESNYKEEVMPAYKKLMDLSSEADKSKIRKEMEVGLNNIKKRGWAVMDLVNEKKGRVAKEVLLVGNDNNSDSEEKKSNSKPQNFHKKLEFPSFTDGQERNYPSFKRKWKATVSTSYPDSVQKDIIQEKVPKEIEPEIKNALTMEEVWKILDVRYGQPDIVSAKLIKELVDLKFTASAKHDCQKFIELYTAYIKARNDLKEIEKLDCLKHDPTIDTVVRKLPGQELKVRWSFWKAKKADQVVRDGVYEVWDQFMEEEIAAARIFRSTLETSSNTDEKIRCSHCSKVGHKEKDCFIKYPSKKIARTNAISAGPSGTQPLKNCPACNSVHSFKNKVGQTVYTTRMSKCIAFMNMSSDGRAALLDKVGGCALCTDYSGQHKRDNCDATVKGKPFNNCMIQDNGQVCGKKHNHLLHGTSVQYVNNLRDLKDVDTEKSAKATDEGGESNLEYEAIAKEDVLLQLQDIRVKGNETRTGLVFWDNGSTLCLIREAFASKLRLEGRRVCLWVQAAGHDPEKWETTVYSVRLLDRDDIERGIIAFSVESITSEIENMNIRGAAQLFPQAALEELRRPNGPVDILVGINFASLHPTVVDIKGDLRLLRSRFGKGWVLDGRHPSVKTKSKGATMSALAHKLCHARVVEVIEHPLTVPTEISELEKINYLKKHDFFEMEELATVGPKRCNNCLDCNKCSDKNYELSRRERRELQAIRDNMFLDKENKEIKFTYPLVKDPSVLTDNRSQAIALAGSLEKRLRRNGELEVYNEALKEFLGRGCLAKLTEEEMKSWDGIVNYVSHHGVPKPGSTTTPLRIVSNSSINNNNSGHSYNSCLAKGPNSIASLFGVLVTWRTYPDCLVYDIHKAYNAIVTGEEEKHARRLVWRWGKEDQDWSTYAFVRMHFGDVPAAAGLQVAKELVAQEGRKIDEDTANKMEKGGYVDDQVVGGSKDECAKMRGECTVKDGEYYYDGTISKILELGGMRPKVIVANKDEDDAAIQKLGDAFLGYSWGIKDDVIKFQFVVNMSKKKYGVKLKPPLTMENICELETTELTLRIVVGVLASQYDPLGLNSPRTIKYKIMLKNTHLSIKEWDQLFEGELLRKWRRALEEMVRSETVVFKRAAVEEEVISIEIIGYWDGSNLAYAGVVYLRCRYKNGWRVNILAAKARVTPAKGLTPPRAELNGLLILCRLISACKSGLALPPDRITVIGDSECTISSVESEEGILAPYFARRCEEIEEHMKNWSQTCQVDPLYHTPGSLNISDLATRGVAKDTDVDVGSTWQEGPSYLKQERDEWPISREFRNKIPDEEVSKSFSVINAIRDKTVPNETFTDKINEVMDRHGKLSTVLGVVARIVRSKGNDREAMKEEPSPSDLEIARFLLEFSSMSATQEAINKGKLVGLSPFLYQGRWFTKGRLGKGVFKILGVDKLVVLQPCTRLAYLIMREAHEEIHHGAKETLWRSRSRAWIVRGYKLAEKVSRECQVCLIKRKELVNQRMGDLPERKFDVCPPFTNVTLDLAAPIMIKSMVNSRANMKAWPLIIVCLNTGAVQILLMHNYGAEAFLLQWSHFTSLRGNPRTVVSDRGSQLTKSAKWVAWSDKEDPSRWDWDWIKDATARLNTTWEFVPPACQWRNGLSENRVKILKQTLALTLDKNTLNYAELQMLLASCANTMNDRPVGVRFLSEEDYVPVTVNQLLLGRTSTTAGSFDLATAVAVDIVENRATLSRRMKYLSELETAWWRQFHCQAFSSFLPFHGYKESKRHNNLRVGDVCLLKYENKIKADYKYCRVESVFPDDQGVVRTVNVKMRPRDNRDKALPYKAKAPVVMNVGVQRLVLIVPAEDIEVTE